ncbi:DNA methyltransferase [Tepiditoga spiralis]|uniref:DNA methyltransferase n=1 Tax=Tepiditoga spiralis TaxID=2108365 RepID=A0A7G1G6X9_9BACT|nr:16S rRNA (guanine(966)-N(2))-methyltransferase RsmD [Tepiditoga spiralis]BBE31955.1 DNA methyltransferase [Tepiditoga spiralis]
MALKIETGTMRGQTYETVNDKRTRYTPGKLKQILMNIFDFQEVNLLEVFGGSGGFSFEAISNGASSSTIIEVNSKTVSSIIKNLNKLKISNKVQVIKNDFRKAIPKLKNSEKKFNIVFADPPFNLGFCNDFLEILDKNHEIIISGGYIILERSKRENYNLNLKNFVLDESRNYGEITLDIFKKIK